MLYSIVSPAASTQKADAAGAMYDITDSTQSLPGYRAAPHETARRLYGTSAQVLRSSLRCAGQITSEGKSRNLELQFAVGGQDLNLLMTPLEQHGDPQQDADADIDTEADPGTNALTDGGTNTNSDRNHNGENTHEVAAGHLEGGLPMRILLAHQEVADGGDGVSQAAAECHQVEEVLHEAGGVLGNQEDDGDTQQEQVGQDGLLESVDLSKCLGQEVCTAHGVQQTNRGQPEAQQAGTDSAQDTEDTVNQGPNLPAEDTLHSADGQEVILAVGSIAADEQHVLISIHTSDSEEQQGVDDTAGNNGTPDCLGGILDGEVTFLDHLRHGFKAEVRSDDQCQTDAPTAELTVAEGGLEEGSEVREAPVAGEEQEHGSQDAAEDGQTQHPGLNGTGDLDIAQRNAAVNAQHDNTNNSDGADAQIQVEHLGGEPLQNCHNSCGRHSDPSHHDKPG